MKINKKLLLILLGSLILRLTFVKNFAPFGWDQERDVLVIAKMIEQKKPTLSGPVVGGDGGFLLGPLYYYVLTPAYIVMSGSPWALPATSILLDLLTILAIYYLARTAYDRKTALIASTFWAVSWFAILSSLVSWNVILIPLFVSAIMYSAYLFKKSSDPKWLYALAFLAGISLHIHPSVVPITPLLVYLAWPKKFNLSVRITILTLISLIIAVGPLILFELRHSWINTQLFTSFISSAPSHSYLQTTISMITKLPLTISWWVFGKIYPIISIILGFLILLYLVVSFSQKNNKVHFSIMSSAIIILNLLLLVFYRDAYFAEYYFLPMIVPIVIFLSSKLAYIYKKNFFVFFLIITIILFTNLTSYKFDEVRGDGITVKQDIVTLISDFLPTREVDIRYELEPGRNKGIEYLLYRQGIIINENSPNKIILQENSDKDSTIDSNIHSMKEWVSGYKILGFIVE